MGVQVRKLLKPFAQSGALANKANEIVTKGENTKQKRSNKVTIRQ